MATIKMNEDGTVTIQDENDPTKTFTISRQKAEENPTIASVLKDYVVPVAFTAACAAVVYHVVEWDILFNEVCGD